MNSKAIMPFEDYKAACDAIREKTGTSVLIKSGEMAEMISSVEPILQDKTVTPKKSQQVVTADTDYDGLNAVTVEGDANLLAQNIKYGVSIFGINGSYVGNTAAVVARTISGEYTDSTVGAVGQYAFYGCSSLTSIDFSTCTRVSSSAFYSCSALVNIRLPACTTVYNYAFYGCRSISLINLPNCRSIYSSAFGKCSSMTTAVFDSCRTIGGYAFASCFQLTALYLESTSMCTLSASTAFNSTPIGGYSGIAGQYGSIYVPSELLSSYKAATNWVYFSSRFKRIATSDK